MSIALPEQATAIYVALSLLADLAYLLIDPRLRKG